MTEYIGISFPFRIGGRGGVVMSGRTITAQQHLKEVLQVLLGTKEFERGMRPYYGLEDLGILFDDLNDTTKSMAIYKITEKLLLLEPRISIRHIDINAEEQSDGSIAYIVSLDYEEVDSGTAASLTVSL